MDLVPIEVSTVLDQRPKKIKIARVKNKMPAAVQITAEQLLREAKERELEVTPKAPQQKITSLSELRDFQLRKRKDYEDNIRKNRLAMQNWIKYAKFEESQGEIQRARSVFERALDVDYRNVGLWLKYAEMEMRNKQINHARNLWDRAVVLMPRANQFWYKYTYMEEMLGNIAGARQVFERWMEWQPEEQAWHAYINFELRYKELNQARLVYERYILVFERAVEFFGTDNPQSRLLIEFARFEERQKEHDRARVIYKYALNNLPKDECQEIYKAYTLHEKKYGDKLAIEDIILSKRKFQYEEEVQVNPHNYDVWFDYVRLMEEESSVNQTREIYERAVANVPPIKEKRYWRRYIYLWLNYALYEELSVEDVERARQVYRFCLKLIPHRRFTFAKMWLYAAKFEIRQKALTEARKLLGTAIGMCPKDKLFRGYIELEIQLREFDRCRKLYEKFLEFSPENCTTWMRYAELESLLGEIDRARAIYELAINRPLLDMPELLWKAYIDFEIEQCDWERSRLLYRRLLQRTQHVKVWISFANFEICAHNNLAMEDLDDEDEEQLKNSNISKEDLIREHNENEVRKGIVRARLIYREANKALRDCEDKEQRVRLLESWKEFEFEYGDAQTQRDVMKLQPQKIIRSRRLGDERSGWEEYVEYSFPDTDAEKPNQKLLNMAARWAEQMSRKKKSEDSGASSSESSEDDDDDGLQGDEDDNRVLDDDQRTSRPGENFEELQLPDESDDDGE
ncbi:Crooked neck pre-mRNA-splicing factor 1 [Fasciolopsis buskii]|uniref:Crooked neck pre-mRNA-splicing factor 1 n=1 Tax=Fasciolopsis buskii TaxID=27845 RepID=A0A8E0S060_9TREM|nr:Crooked neck pre-mRNA-splicing factor 1 [Fasciolopsis buski]